VGGGVWVGSQFGEVANTLMQFGWHISSTPRSFCGAWEWPFPGGFALSGQKSVRACDHDPNSSFACRLQTIEMLDSASQMYEGQLTMAAVSPVFASSSAGIEPARHTETVQVPRELTTANNSDFRV
jgi:hypothetical protein